MARLDRRIEGLYDANMDLGSEAQLKAWNEQVHDWEVMVDEKDCKCSRCGKKPTYSERFTFFRTGCCLWCATTVDKAD
jgi:hypothetical protein